MEIDLPVTSKININFLTREATHMKLKLRVFYEQVPYKIDCSRVPDHTIVVSSVPDL